jgi:hypothetical protein
VSFGFSYIQPPPMSPEASLNAIWSDGNGRGYAVGNQGTIVAFSRTGWTKETIPDVFSGTAF